MLLIFIEIQSIKDKLVKEYELTNYSPKKSTSRESIRVDMCPKKIFKIDRRNM